MHLARLWQLHQGYEIDDDKMTCVVLHFTYRMVPQRRRASCSASSDNEDEAGSPNPGANGAVAIPQGLRNAGAVFVLAGFLKILIVCFPFSTMAVSMYFQGLADLGTLAAAKMIPLAIAILALAKSVVDKKLHERKWAPMVIAIGGLCALMLSRWAFARPRPSPLDPVIARYKEARRVEAEYQEKKEQELGKRRKLQPEQESRVELLQRGHRFKYK